MLNLNNKKIKGFTLIELLVVIAIIGVMASLAIVNLNQSRKKSRDARRMADIKEIDNAIQLYIAKNIHAPYLNDTCPPSNPGPSCSASVPQKNWNLLYEDLAPFIKKLPEDPCGEKCGSGNPFYAYQYYAPGAIAYWCQSVGCGENESALNSMYKIYAEHLEMDGSRWGFQDTFGNSL